MASGFSATLRWLFLLILKLFSDFPTYCFLIRYIPLVKYICTSAIDLVEYCVRFISLLAFKGINSLQQSAQLLAEHGEHLLFIIILFFRFDVLDFVSTD